MHVAKKWYNSGTLKWCYLGPSFCSIPHHVISYETFGLRGAGPREEVERQLQIVALLVHVPLLSVLPPDPKFPTGIPCAVDELVLGCWTWLIFRLALNLERSYLG